MSTSRTPQPTQEYDPFDEEDSEFLSTIDLDGLTTTKELDPPPPKRLRQSENDAPAGNQLVPDVRVPPAAAGPSRVLRDEQQLMRQEIVDLTNDDPFSCDSDDEQLYQIAEALEVKGSAVEGRKAIATPHPLLIPHIYENILSHLHTPSSLLSARQVCTSWNDVLQNRTFQVATIRNLNHIIERYPYGLAYVEEYEHYKAPCPLPQLERIHIADTCYKLKQPEVEEFFRRFGEHVKYIGLDANLYCMDHWRFVRRLLDEWCFNLEELELEGVTCTDSLLSYSELHQRRRYKIKKLTVKCHNALIRNHHHISTINRATFIHRYYLFNRLNCRRDGGLLSRIMINSPRLEHLALHFNFTSVAGYFAGMRVFRVNFSRLKVLELVGVGQFGVDTGDVRVLRTCDLHLRTLKLGPLNPTINGNMLTAFLQSQAPTLEHLHLLGSNPQTTERNRLSQIRFNIPDLPLLKTLELKSSTRYRIGTLEFLYRTPGLDTLSIETDTVPPTNKLEAERAITRMLEGAYNAEHINLRNLKLTGPYTNVIDHNVLGSMLTTMAPKLCSLSVTCTTEAIEDCVKSYSTLRHLNSMSLQVVDQRPPSFKDIVRLFEHPYEGLRSLSVAVSGSVPLRLEQVGRVRNLYELTLDGFLIHDNESKSVAKLLAEKINYIHFKNCKLVKPGTATVFGYVGKKTKPIPGITTLTLVNLPVMIEKHFRAI